MAPKDNVNPPGANTIRVTYEGNNYDWTLTEPSLDINNNIIQSAIGKLYVIECTLFTDTTYDWGPLMTSSTYAAAKAAYNLSVQAIADADDALTAINLLGGHFIYNGTSSGQSTPAGAGVIQYVEDDPDDWGYNTWIGSNGIQLRHGETVDAFLYTNGLIVEKGGIRTSSTGVYPPGTNNGIYISTDNYSDVVSGHNNGTIPLDNYTKTNWRAIIGSKFAVDSEGNLYANNANIEGSITATSLTIGTGQDAYSGIEAINISGYSISIISDSTGVQDPSVGTNLYPHIYHNGIEITDDMIETEDTTIDINKTYYSESGGVYTIATPVSNPKTEGLYEKEINPYDFLWYQDNNSIGTHGSSVDGHYYATYGHLYNVIYDFDDGAVGAGTAVQTREVDPQKYITKIDDYGITIHPENQSLNNYMRLDSDSLKFYKNNINVAEYGTNIRIGSGSDTHVIITDGTVSPYTTAGIYLNDNNTILAKFTENGTQIGLSNSGHVLIDSNSVDINDGSNTLATFSANGAQIGKDGTPNVQIQSTGIVETNDYDVSCFEVNMNGGTHSESVTTYDDQWFDLMVSNMTASDSDSQTNSITLSGYNTGDQVVVFSYPGMTNYDVNGNFYFDLMAGSGYVPTVTITSTNVESFYRRTVPNPSALVYGVTLNPWTITIGTNSSYSADFTVSVDSGGDFSLAVSATYTASTNKVQVTATMTYSGAVTQPAYVLAIADGNINQTVLITTKAPSYSLGQRLGDAGIYSAIIGEGLYSTGEHQTSVGRYNIEDDNDEYAFIVGNGTAKTGPSNALTVDWSGNIDAAGDIYPQNTKMVDFIIEQGTSGSWEYRKWKSGKIEAWYNSSITASATETSGALYRSTWSLSIPSAIGFTSAPKIIVNEDYDAVGVVSIIGKASSGTAISGKVWRTTASSGTYNGYPRIYAWGS